jgi:N-acetylmuramoyl-L-alanine amidase
MQQKRQSSIFFIIFVCCIIFVCALSSCALSNNVYGLNNKEKDSQPDSQLVEKIYLKKENDIYFLCVKFNKNVAFIPRIHTLPKGIKVLLSFNREVEVPPTKKTSHQLIQGYFFERFSPSSLMFVAALKDNVTFVSKKYDKHSIKIGFKVYKKRIIVIDPGHGGKDPGTKGITENCEKNITLITAIELRNALIKSKKYKVVLTRDRDIYTSIDERKEKVPQADMLISLHTDSNNDKNLRGMSIYTLPDHIKSRLCSSSGGNSSSISSSNITEDSDTYRKTLLKSRRFAKSLLKYIPNACRIKNSPSRNSELKILKANMPAVLIELGCISNKIDNELLLSQDFRNKTVSAIGYALDDFFEKEER